MIDDVDLTAFYEEFGWAGLPVILVVVGVRILRMPAVQFLLPDNVQWDKMHKGLRVGLVFAAALCASIAASMIAGKPFGVGFMTAIPVALLAIAGHKGTKALGHAETARRVTKRPDYKPSKFRRAASIVVPLDTKALRDGVLK